MRKLRSFIVGLLLMSASAHAAEPVEKITFTNKLIDGKKTWIPTEVTIKGGSKVEITLVNELEDPHGFSIPGVTDPLVIKGKETTSVTVPAPKAGEYKFLCQMHPAHVGGKIIVSAPLANETSK